MQPATLWQNAQCDASDDGSCLNTTLRCLPPCSNVRIWIRRPEQMEANQASLCPAEGLQIRGFARQAASMASTRQSNQEQNPRSIATKVTGVKVNIICYASPSSLTTKTMQAAMSGSKEFEHLVFFHSIYIQYMYIYIYVYRHATENGENTDI